MRRLLVTVAALAAVSPAMASDFYQSLTVLSAAQEVQNPPVASDGVARAFIAFDAGFTSATVRVGFTNLVGDEVTRLHLHCNKAGDNGPIAIGLIDFVDPNNDNSDVIDFEGNIIFGTLSNADFPQVDPCPDVIGHPVNNIVSLAAAIDAGLIYWNLHSNAFPAGELRGQVRETDGVTFDD